jgi:LAO/AO transport system kinase
VIPNQDKSPSNILAVELLLGKENPLPIEISKTITLLLNSKFKLEEISEWLRIEERNSLMVCITGLPGSGKSSLLNRILEHREFKERRIAILAIDPSSRFGGAFLGDRIRLSKKNEEYLFFRSVGHRGQPSTLPPNLDAIAAALFHFGYEYFFVETIGFGQVHNSLPEIFDLVVNVQTLTNGDEIQFAKSGLMEIGDIVFFNKIENNINKNLITEFQYVANLRQDKGSKNLKVIGGSTFTDEGIDDLVFQLVNARKGKSSCL